jgi:hypothetical protein
MDVMTISTGNAKLDHIIGLVGTLVTLSSLLAGALNSRIRASIASEGEVFAPFLYLSLLVNVLAINIDKATQMSKLIRGKPVKVLDVEQEKP